MKLPRDDPVVSGRPFIELEPDITARIMRTVDAGWKFALKSPEVNAHAGEVPMTERLRDGMRSALKDSDLRTMVVLPGTESRSRLNMTRPDGQTDIPVLIIQIFLRIGEHDPHAIIECKRVAGGNARLCREYVVNGIDRFRDGKYAGNHAAGFMVGYVIAGGVPAAAVGIDKYLKRKNRGAECLNRSGLVNEPWVRESRHPRSGAETEEVTIHHAFLNACSAKR